MLGGGRVVAEDCRQAEDSKVSKFFIADFHRVSQVMLL
jgi:hypothetical protein